jgi:hypothetical protein
VRRPLFVTIVGLALAFGVFYWLGWPSSLNGPPSGSREAIFMCTPHATEQHAVLGPFAVVGRKGIDIQTVRLEDPLPGTSLTRASVGPVEDPLAFFKAEGGRDLDELPSVAGATLRPGQRFRIYLTYNVPPAPGGAGPGGFRGIRLGYRSGWLSRSGAYGQRAGC